MSYPRFVVIDTNKILASILRPGRVREALFNQPAIIITPREAWAEAERHIEEITARKGIPRERIKGLLEDLKGELITPTGLQDAYIKTAKEIAGEFDSDDWPFIALALQYNAPVWTNDREMIRHSLETRRYKALDTRALEMLLEGKSWRQIEEYLKERYCPDNKTRC
ncbi:MAG: PIN domain-containing protein [Desulfurococcales archaeon]|nr:PIN domain-containing protein [Desulfurococcales archaeon]